MANNGRILELKVSKLPYQPDTLLYCIVVVVVIVYMSLSIILSYYLLGQMDYKEKLT